VSTLVLQPRRTVICVTVLKMNWLIYGKT